MTTPATKTIALSNGKSARTIRAGKPNTFKAHATEHYRIVKIEDGKEQLLDDVIAKRSGDNLVLQYADNTQVTLKNYYVECKTASACEVTLPGKDAAGYKINAAATIGADADVPVTVYVHGNHDVLLDMTKGDDALHKALAGIKGADITFIPSSSQGLSGSFFGDKGNFTLLSILGGGLGVAALAGGAGPGAPVVVAVHNAVSGTVVAGPVTAGNGLTVNLYQGDGNTLLGSGKLSGTGTFSIDVGSYSGAVVAKLVDASAGNDYRDEASGQLRDLSANLMAVGEARSGTVMLNINALTTVAALNAGAIFNGPSSVYITTDMAAQNNAAVASAFGLTDLTGTSVVTTINADGSANSAYDPDRLGAGANYGAILAALSGVDAANGGHMQTTIDDLLGGLSVSGTLSAAALSKIIGGANMVSVSTSGSGTTNSLTSIVSNLTAPYSAAISIAPIATDNIINGSEQTATLTGTITNGGAVSLDIGGTVRSALVSGTGWSYTLTAGDITHMGQGGTTITATSGGDSVTRSIVVDTVAPAAPTAVTLTPVGGTLVADTINSSNTHLTAQASIVAAEAAGGSARLKINGTTVAIDSSIRASDTTVTFTTSDGTPTSAELQAAIAAGGVVTVELTDAAGNTSVSSVGNPTLVRDMQPPTVASVAITSASGMQNNMLNAGDVVHVSVTMSEAVNVDTTGGTPQLALNIGGATVRADYVSGSGTDTLVFDYTILGSQTDANGIGIAANSLTLHGGILTDIAGNPATLTHGSVADNAGFMVDNTAPTVSSVAITSASGMQNGWLNTGDVVHVTVVLSEAILVTGTPQLALNIGGTTVLANYVSGSGSNTLLFDCIIQAGLADSNGISIIANSLAPNNGTLTDAAGNAVILAHGGVTDNSAYPVDTIAAAPSVALTTDSGASNSDRITHTGSLTVSGTEPGSTIEYNVNGTSGWSGSFSPQEGSNTVYVRQTDIAGNVSAASSAYTFTLDTGVATPVAALTTDSGASGSDRITNSGSLSVSGTELNATIQYSIDGTTWSGSFNPVEGGNTVYVRQTDVAGNVSSASNVYTFTLDTLAAAPSVALTTDSGSYSYDKITNNASLTVSGTELNATVEYSTDNTTWSSSFNPVEGNNTVYVRQTDVAGNVSSASSAYTFTLDTSVATPGVALTTDTGSNSSDGITHISNLSVSGVEAGALVQYSTDGTSGWSNSFNPAEGSNTVYVRQTDVAGNVSSPSSAYTFTLDTGAYAPNITLTTDSGANGSDRITNIGDLTVSGTEPGATVEYSTDGTAWSGSFTAQEGSNTVYVRQTDVAGNVSAASSAYTFTLDSSAPAVSSVAITSATDSTGTPITGNTLDTGNVVYVTVTMTQATLVTGTPQLALDIGGTTVQAHYVSGSGSTALVFGYSVQQGLNDGNGISIAANSLALNSGTLADAAGNAAALSHAPVSDNGNYLVSASTPDTFPPAVTSIILTSATGIQNTILNAGDVVHVTVNMSEPTTVTGTPQLALNIGAATVFADYVSGSGSTALVFDYTIQAGQNDANGIGIAAGSITFNGATFKDAANNSASTLPYNGVSDNAGFLVDTTAPTLTVGGVHISADSGANSTDFLTRTAAQTITGTLSGTLAGGDILYGSVDNGGTWTDITGKVTGTAISWNGTTLAGSSAILFKITDAAGNDSATTGSTAYVLDTTAPTLTVGSVHISADTGASASDFITRTAAQTISGTLSSSLATGDILYGSVDNGTTWSNITAKVSGSAISWDGATLAGSSNILFKVTDAAGNDSAATGSTAYVLDATAPTQTVAGVHISADNGTSSTDFLTNTASQTISGSLSGALVAGEILYGSVDNGASWSNITAKVSGTAISWDGATLAGSSAILFKITDAAGNDSAATGSTAYALDTTAPTQTVGSVHISADTGTSSSDFITRTASQTITGTLSGALASGDILYGSVDNGSTWTNITGKLSGTAISWNGATLAGSSAILFKVTDAAGNDSAATGSTAYVLDTTAPALTVSSVGISADTGTSASDFITRTATQTITGTLSGALAAGDILYGSVDNGSTWTNITSKVSGSAISWNGATLAGSSAILFKVTDAAGNDSATTGSTAYVLDTTAPTLTVGNVHISADSGTSPTDFLTNTASQTITGTLSAALSSGDILYGSVDNGASWTNITAKASGSAISWDGATLAGSSAILFKITDAAGNDSATTGSTAYVLDTAVPTLTIASVHISADTGSSASDFITNTASQTISGTLSAALAAGDILYGSVDNGATWTDITYKLNGYTAISWNGATLSGSSAILFKITDAAGNDSAATGSTAYVLDTTAPTAPTSVTLTAVGGTVVADTINNSNAYLTAQATIVAGEATGGSALLKIDGTTVAADNSIQATDTTVDFTTSDGTPINAELQAAIAAGGVVTVELTDAAGNTSVSSVGNPTLLRDMLSPAVESVGITSATGIQGNTLNTGDVVHVTVTLSEAAIVTGTPQLALNIGGATVQANYVSGSGSTALVFDYTILQGDTDTDGISIDGNSLSLNGGTLRDAAGNDATLTHASVADNAGYIVPDTTPPTVSGIVLSSADDTQGYQLLQGTPVNAGEVVHVTATLSEASILDTTHGTPQVTLNIGGTLVQAHYDATLSGPTTLVFDYTILAGQTDTDGISIVANSLALNGATLTDIAGNTAVLTHPAVADNADFVVDNTAPTVSSVAITSATDILNNGSSILNTGDVVEVTVTMDESIQLVYGVSGPQLALNIGGATVYADYNSRGTSNLNQLVFDYTILSGQVDANGIGIDANSIRLNGSTLTDIAGNAALTNHASVADNPGYTVAQDTIAPTVSSIAITSADNNHNTILNAGDVVHVTVSMSEPVLVDLNGGTPQLALNIGGATVQASYNATLSGTDTLVFDYTILQGQTDTNGIGIDASSLALNGASIADPAGNAAVLTHAAVADNAGYIVNTGQDTTNVVFDLVHGVSSSHSGHTFDANVTYDIYILVDSTSATLHTSPQNGAATGASWNQWLGGANLGADDRITLVGSGSAVQGPAGHAVTLVSASAGVIWNSSAALAASIAAGGVFARTAPGGHATAALWTGAWQANPDSGRSVTQIHKITLPTGILHSQGLI